MSGPRREAIEAMCVKRRCGGNQAIAAVCLLLPLFSCGPAVDLPEGDAAAGRAVFANLSCHSCHRVHGESFPSPIADPPVPVVLKNPSDRKSRRYLLDAIVAPSHRFARPRQTFSELPPTDQEREFEDIKSGSLSRMGDFSEAMTVRELIDLVAYLEER